METLSSPSPVHQSNQSKIWPVTSQANGFVAALFCILVSELGDKTFVITTILAMKYSKKSVFLGALTAATLMISLSGLWHFVRKEKKFSSSSFSSLLSGLPHFRSSRQWDTNFAMYQGWHVSKIGCDRTSINVIFDPMFLLSRRRLFYFHVSMCVKQRKTI